MQKEMPKIIAALSDYYPSMAQDMLMHERQTEVTALTGAIADYGKKAGVPTPVCDVLTRVIKAWEANYSKQYFRK
jgi:2-dehydropantoate 2-reductase